VYGGPTCEVRPGDYVACLVTEVVGNATLLAQPLARTSVAEFTAAFGGTAPGRLATGHGAAGWMAQATAATAAGPWGFAAGEAVGAAGARPAAVAAFGQGG
jgi:hypothetical protein